jgi:hypothetical protein
MKPVAFLTAVSGPQDAPAARLMIDSLRSFAGELGACPVWVFDASPQGTASQGLETSKAEIFKLEIPAAIREYYFSEKVCACAQAESMAVGQVNSLVWIDPACLVLRPPNLFDLGETYDAALRPVHIRNVGLPAGAPLDRFWEGVYQQVGIPDIPTTVQSFIDQQTLRSYFNSHAFAIRPSLGLLHRWLEDFTALVCDHEFQQAACQDGPHQVFLFQALLSARLAASLDARRLRLLPPDYNYPYHLHNRVPAGQRPQALNELTLVSYEQHSLRPDQVRDIEIHEPLRTWLAQRIGG